MRRLKWLVPLVVLLSLLVSPAAFAAPAQSTAVQQHGAPPSWSGCGCGSCWYGYCGCGYCGCGYCRCGYWRPVYCGDTLYSIALSTGVSWQAIAAANGLYNPNVIYAGSSLWIPCR